jgi:hypothetical protein
MSYHVNYDRLSLLVKILHRAIERLVTSQQRDDERHLLTLGYRKVSDASLFYISLDIDFNLKHCHPAENICSTVSMKVPWFAAPQQQSPSSCGWIPSCGGCCTK